MDRTELKMKLLTDFQKQYPIVTSADLQTFTLGMIALEESLDKEVVIKGNLFQLFDQDDDLAGLILTDADGDAVQVQWSRFVEDDTNVDNFVNVLKEKFGVQAERVYTEDFYPR